MKVMPKHTNSVSISRIAIFSDIHLGVHTNSGTWHKISYNWAEWFTENLRKENIKDIVFCGDFFHNRSEITVNTLYHAGELLNLFQDFNIHMLAGNHDSFYKNNCSVNSIKIFEGRPNITIYDKPTLIQLGGQECFFAPWGTDIEQIEQCDILFGHFEIESFKMNTYKMCEEGIKSENLFKKAPLIISGHFHLREERKYDKGTILYVGSPFELDFGDENSTKGFYILSLKDRTYKFYLNNISPQHKKINLSNLIKINNFKEVGTGLLNNNFVKLVVDKNISNQDLDKLTAKLNAFKPTNIVVDNDIAFDRLGLGEGDNVDLSGVNIEQAIAEFVDMLDIKNKKEVTDYTLHLYAQCK